MENNVVNNNQEQKSVEARTVNQIKFVPNHAVMFMSDTDLAKIVLANMESRFKGVAGVTVAKTGNKNSPIKVRVAFHRGSDVFVQTMNPAIAALINSDSLFEVTEDAKKALEPFITSRTSLNVEELHSSKGRNSTLAFELNPLKTLSSCINIEAGTLIQIGKIQEISKYNFMMEVVNFVPVKMQHKKKKNNNNNNNQRNNNGGNRNYRR